MAGKGNKFEYSPNPRYELWLRRFAAGDDLLAKPLPVVRRALVWLCTAIAYALALLAIIPLLSLLWEILRRGLPNFSWGVLTALPTSGGTEEVNGFGHAIVGTLTIVGLSSLAAIPLGISVGIYLAEFRSDALIDRLLQQAVRFSQRILASLPSIIIGVFAYGVLVLTTKKFSILAGSFALVIVMIPTIALTTEEALLRVPQTWRLAAAALGGNQLQVLTQVILKSARQGIATGCLLAIARAAGETAPLIFTALYSLSWPEGLLEPSAALPVLIFKYATSSVAADKQLAWTAAVVLLMLVLGSSLLSRYLLRQRNFSP